MLLEARRLPQRLVKAEEASGYLCGGRIREEDRKARSDQRLRAAGIGAAGAREQKRNKVGEQEQ
tara:strand:+ start:439 stop:630 length:192 start_codon:yes stop_codon:yes gene_type:complete